LTREAKLQELRGYFVMNAGVSGPTSGAHMAVNVGQKAPAFAGKAVVGGAFKDIKLEDYKGKWVVLWFYPLAFTPV